MRVGRETWWIRCSPSENVSYRFSRQNTTTGPRTRRNAVAEKRRRERVGSGRRVGSAQPPSPNDLLVRNAPPRSLTHTQIPLQSWGIAKYDQGTRRSVYTPPNAFEYAISTSIYITKNGRISQFRTNLTPFSTSPKSCFLANFGPFEPFLPRLADFGQFWRGTGRFPGHLRSSCAHPRRIQAVNHPKTGLNHLRYPHTHQIWRFRTILTIFRPFWPIRPIFGIFSGRTGHFP